MKLFSKKMRVRKEKKGLHQYYEKMVDESPKFLIQSEKQNCFFTKI